MSKLSFRARALDASKPMPIYLAEELPDLPDYSAINRAVPQMPSGMEKEEESEHHLQRAISGTGLIIPTPEVCEVTDLVFYERCYPPDYKMPKQHIHMQPLWEEQEAPEYDIDSEDERWLKQQRHPDLTELVFEQMMDKLEKCSGQTVVTLSEAKLLLDRHDDLVIAVYDYWLNKRLNTQHPLILSVRTESRPGQPANNPYLAFRRRTEKMQTRKNRKNDESSYEKMLKLRRDLARALTLLQLVARRERAKRDLVRLTHALSSARYRAGDFAPDPPPRPAHVSPAPLLTPRAVFAAVPAGGAGAASALRRDAIAVQFSHTPDRQPRPREKRPYKRKKHRHHMLGAIPPPHRAESGGSSSEEEAGLDTPASPDPGPFAFRRKPGCYYEMPTSTLCGEPLPADRATDRVQYEHEVDERHRYTLASLSVPWAVCVGLARRRVGRGGRVLLDRRASPLDELWARLPAHVTHTHQEESETKVHRAPKETYSDYHSSGRYPWRHAFRRHLARNPHLWIQDIKPDPSLKTDDTFKMEVDEFKVDLPQDSDISIRTVDSVCDPIDVDSAVRDNLQREMRKRAWSSCSDDSEDAEDEELYPVEKEFENFIDEVSRKWLHFRPKTPPPSPDECDAPDEPLPPAEPFSVELRALGAAQGGGKTGAPPPDWGEPFTTADLTLQELFPDVANVGCDGLDMLGDSSVDLGAAEEVTSMDVDTDDFLSQGQGSTGRASPGRGAGGSSRVSVRAAPPPPVPRPRPPTPASAPPPQVERPPSPVKKVQTPVKEESKREERERERQLERDRERAEKERERQEREHARAMERERDRERGRDVLPKERRDWPTSSVEAAPSPVPNSRIIVEEVNELPPQIKLEKKKSADTIEEVVLAHGVQLKTVQTKHSPLKKHIITSGAARRPQSDVIASSAPSVQEVQQPQLLTVAVSDNLKVRIQNHIVSERVSGVGGVGVVGLVGNGPFPAPTTAHPACISLHTTHTVASVATVASSAGGGSAGVSSAGAVRRVAGVGCVTSRAPLVQLAGAHAHAAHAQHAPVVLAPSHTIHHVAPNKLKVLHAHPLTHQQRNQLLSSPRGMASLPAVVSLATLGDAKTSSAALLKAPAALTQFFEIKGTQFGKGPHLVNVVRGGGAGGAGAAGGAGGGKAVARLDLNDPKKRQVVATIDPAHLKGNIQTVSRPHRVNVSVERGVVRAGAGGAAGGAGAGQPVAVRAHHLRHQIQLKGRALVGGVGGATAVRAAGLAGEGGKALPGAVVANLLHKGVLPKGGQKIAISSGVGVGGVSVGGVGVGSVQAIAFSTAQLKARQARLIAPTRHLPQPHSELVESGATTSGGAGGGGAGGAGGEGDDPAQHRRPNDTLPMEVT